METQEKIAKIQGCVGKLQEAIDELDFGDVATEISVLEERNGELTEERDRFKSRCNDLEERNAELCSKLENVDPEDAATMLLEHYLSDKPGAGDVDALKCRITDILVSEFGVSRGILP